MLAKAVLVGLGGFLGAIARFGINNISKNWLKNWPIGTLLANLVGTFLMASLLYGLFGQKQGSDSFRLFVLVGFCGSLTTMSSFAVDVVQLHQNQAFVPALIYFMLNAIGCLLVVLLARYLFS